MRSKSVKPRSGARTIQDVTKYYCGESLRGLFNIVRRELLGHLSSSNELAHVSNRQLSHDDKQTNILQARPDSCDFFQSFKDFVNCSKFCYQKDNDF